MNSNFIFSPLNPKINNNREGSIHRRIRFEGRERKKKAFCVRLIKGHPRFAFPRSHPGKVSWNLFALDTKKNAIQDTYSLGEVKILVVATFPENASVCSRCVRVVGLGICCVNTGWGCFFFYFVYFFVFLFNEENWVTKENVIWIYHWRLFNRLYLKVQSFICAVNEMKITFKS